MRWLRALHRTLTVLVISGRFCVESPATEQTPVEWLRSQVPPKFELHHTLPPLTRWNGTMDLETRKELAEHWGYAVEFGGYVSEQVAESALLHKETANAQCLALVAQNPTVFKLGVLLNRGFPTNPPPEAYLRDKDGHFILDEKGNKIWSPEMPQAFLELAAHISVDGLTTLQRKVPVTVVLNGGEYGLNVLGFVHKEFQQDPTVLKAKGNLSWYEYLSRQKAREQRAIYDAVRRACPDHMVYVYYPAGGDVHRRGPEGRSPNFWCWDYRYMRYSEDYPSNEYYYKESNSGWVGSNDMLTQALGAKGYELKFGGSNSYDWLCAGFRDDPQASRPTAFDSSAPIEPNAPKFADLRLYEGFLKCLYTEGMIGACAGYFSYPNGGFNVKFPDDRPPHWLMQMVVLSRVHALFSHLERFLRDGVLLPGPSMHKYVPDQPAYEFPTGSPGLRVLVRRLPNEQSWLLTAWDATGKDREASVEIPQLGHVSLRGLATGRVYTATLNEGRPVTTEVDAR